MRKLMKKVAKKIRSNSGETLVETLVAIIICVFASTMMCGAVATASKLNMDARIADEKFRANLALVEDFDGADPTNKEDGTVTIIDSDTTVAPTVIDVTFIKSGNTADDFKSYVVK